MKCFYHHRLDSIGVCRSCGRGLCPDCITEYPEGLACKNRCEEAVEETISLVKRNRVAVAKPGINRFFYPFFFLVLGAIQLYQGIFESKGAINTFTALGVIFIVGGILYLIAIRRFYRD